MRFLNIIAKNMNIKVLSKGEHKIDGKTYKVDKNLYDTVPKDNKNGIYESIKMEKPMCIINVISYQKRRIHE